LIFDIWHLKLKESVFKKTKQKLVSLKKLRKSFTLVEVIVAMVILMMIIGGMARIEISNIRLADSGKKQLQATGLARGALNSVRTIRDTNILKSDPDTFAGIDKPVSPAPPAIKHLVEASSQWSLQNGNTTQTIDGTTYTVEITIQ